MELQRSTKLFSYNNKQHCLKQQVSPSESGLLTAKNFLNTISDEYKASTKTLSFDSKDGVTTLGLLWFPDTDHFQVRQSTSAITCPASNSSQQVTLQRAQPALASNTSQQVPLQRAMLHASTKRQVLGHIASIFDPLGLLSPSVIAYKVFLQKLWQDNLLWDEQLTDLRQEEWNQLMLTLPQLTQIRIPRKVICTNATAIHLHGFCDSSEQAYGACMYIRSNRSNQPSVQLFVVFFIKGCSTEKIDNS